MLELKKIELSDKQWIDPLLKLSDFRGCEYNFTNNFVWSGVYNITVGRFQDFYVSKHGNCFVAYAPFKAHLLAFVNILRRNILKAPVKLFKTVDIITL